VVLIFCALHIVAGYDWIALRILKFFRYLRAAFRLLRHSAFRTPRAAAPRAHPARAFTDRMRPAA
jgi:hypothetical protein